MPLLAIINKVNVEFLKGLLEKKLQNLSNPRTYDGMSGDIRLLSQAIIQQDPTQNVETTSSFEIGPGIPEEALQRLKRQGRMGIGQIAREINRRYGHPETEEERLMNIDILISGLKNLQQSKR